MRTIKNMSSIFYQRIKSWPFGRGFMMGVFLLVTSGCATLLPWTQLKGQEYKDGPRGFKAIVPAGWMRFNQAKYFIMTNDGTILDQIVVERRKVNTKLEFTKKEFAAEMTPQDLAEIEIDNLKADGRVGKVMIIQNKPETIADQSGFRMEYDYVITEGGLKIHGIHYGFLYDRWVYRIHYEAADQHYFRKYLKDFEHFIDSFQLL